MAPPAEIFLHSLDDNSEDESPEKCRLRRRRRIEKRRLKFRGAYHLFPPPSPGHSYMPLLQPSLVRYPVENPMPVFGSISIRGLSRSTDDEILVKPEFCRPDIVGRKPLHFFAVFDGHGGPQMSTFCRNTMHLFLAEELTRVWNTEGSASGDMCGSYNSVQQNHELDEDEWEESLKSAVRRSFQKMDQVGLHTSPRGQTGYEFGSPPAQPMDLAFVGSTAVVAILAAGHIVVANRGGSRAVLCRAGSAMPLCLDHEPKMSDELERINAAGGQLVHKNGVRVCGILNMSHSVGEGSLKSIAISQPEISITERDPQDECLILATHGLWDVLSDDIACKVACTCLGDGTPASSTSALRDTNSRSAIKDDRLATLFPSQSALAAAILCRLALARGSHDNISIVVVDLKRRGREDKILRR